MARQSFVHCSQPEWHLPFLRMLRTIKRCARFAFRHQSPEQRQESEQEVVVQACIAYARLVERGRPERARPTILAKHAVARVRCGRHLGSAVNDVTSQACHMAKQIRVKSLYGQAWTELLVADGRATPADLAASRIDFAEWLRTLSPRDRRV